MRKLSYLFHLNNRITIKQSEAAITLGSKKELAYRHWIIGYKELNNSFRNFKNAIK